MTRQDLVDRLVAERFAPPIRQAPTTTLGTARLLTASAEAEVAVAYAESHPLLAKPPAIREGQGQSQTFGLLYK